VRMVYECRQAVEVPIIGMGGISTPEDALEFIIAGADAVGVGTAIFSDPSCLKRIPKGIEDFLAKEGVAKVSDLVGTVKTCSD